MKRERVRDLDSSFSIAWIMEPVAYFLGLTMVFKDEIVTHKTAGKMRFYGCFVNNERVR